MFWYLEYNVSLDGFFYCYPSAFISIPFISTNEAVTLWDKDCWAGGHNQVKLYYIFSLKLYFSKYFHREKFNGYKQKVLKYEKNRLQGEWSIGVLKNTLKKFEVFQSICIWKIQLIKRNIQKVHNSASRVWKRWAIKCNHFILTISIFSHS